MMNSKGMSLTPALLLALAILLLSDCIGSIATSTARARGCHRYILLAWYANADEGLNHGIARR